MPTVTARDGTELAYRTAGAGPPLLCLPGGPMLDATYLGDLGGLEVHRELILVDLRGTGASAVPEDTTSYRCDRQVDDVEALREHLGLARFDLLAHSAGANLAVMYAAAHPDRIGRLLLITPSTRAVGVEITAQMRLDVARLRAGASWFPDAIAALERITQGAGAPADWDAITPFSYGRWDAGAVAHHAAEAEQAHPEAAAAFGADGVFAPEAARAAMGNLRATVLILAGEIDVSAPPAALAQYAGLFPDATLVVQPSAGHFPWLDDAAAFANTVAAFLV